MAQYSPQQIKEYSQCLEILYTGGHKGGLPSCPYCAEIYRRYHPQVTKEQEVCNCCGGNPGNCYQEACMKAGFCLSCTETVTEDEADAF